MRGQQTDHPHERGQSTLDTSALARDAAGEATSGTQFSSQQQQSAPNPDQVDPSEYSEFQEGKPGEVPGTEPNPQVEGQQPDFRDAASEANQRQQPDDTQQQQTEPQTEQERQDQIEETRPEPGQQLTDEDFEDLKDLGVELPMKPSEVPPEAQDAYADLVQQVINAETRAAEVQAQANEQVMRVRQFAEQVQENPQQLLLQMAIQDPETFSEVRNKFEKMQNDPDYAESVRRDLAAEQKMREAERMQKAQTQTQRQRKARQLKTRTRRKAKRLGIDPDLAEEQVANAAIRNMHEQGLEAPDIDLQEADQVVEQFAERAGTPERQTSRRDQQAKSPDTQQAEETAPTQQTEGRSRESQQRQSPGTTEEAPQSGGIGSRLVREAVRESARNVRSKGL